MMFNKLPKPGCQWLAVVMVFHACCSRAATVEEMRRLDAFDISLEDLPAAVLTHNPDLKSARWAIEVARGRMVQAGRLSHPNLQTSIQDNTRTAEYAFGVVLQQSFPVTARLRLEKTVARHQIQEAEAEVDQIARLRIESALEQAVRLLGNRLRQAVLKDQINLAEEWAGFLKTQSQRGEASPLDATRAVLLAEEYQLRLRPIRTRTKQIESDLRALLGFSPGKQLRIEGDFPPIELPAASEIQFAKRPEMRLVMRRIETAKANLKLERANRMDDFRLGLGHQWSREQDAPIGLEAERQYNLQLSVPLPFWNRNEGSIRAVQAELNQLEASQESLEITIHNQVDAAYTAMIEHLAMYREITEAILPRRQDYQRELEDAYRQGLSSFESLLRAQEHLLELKFAQAEAVESFHLSRIQYFSAIGNFSKNDEK